MKKIILSMFVVASLASCGGADPAADAQACCDCSKKANKMSRDGDANAAAEMEKCSKLQMDNWNKYKDNMDDANKFNVALGECSKEVMEEAMKGSGN